MTEPLTAVTAEGAATALPTLTATATAIVTATTTIPGATAGATATPVVRPGDLPPTGIDLNGGTWPFFLPLLLVGGLFAPSLWRYHLARGRRAE